MLDKWKHLRTNLWANTEPEVKIEGLTVPVEAKGHLIFPVTDLEYSPDDIFSSGTIEAQVSLAAAVSTGASIKDHAKTIKHLLKLKHDTPFEAIQFNFRISGISKAAGAQMSRHRIGQGHVSSSRRYQEQGIQFVYPLLNNIDDEDAARQAYLVIQDSYQAAYSNYIGLRRNGAKKGDARYVIPTASSQERIWWVNARALRDFFRLRLDPDAEGEIRRLALILLATVIKIAPTIFEDICKMYNTNLLVESVIGPELMSKINKDQP